MSDHNGQTMLGDLRVMRRKATNRLSFTENLLSNKFRTLFYRSDISSLVGNYDVVHIHNPIPTLEMRSIAKACVNKGIPYVLTTHGFVEVLGIESAYKLGRLESLAGKVFVTRPLAYVIENAFKICCLAPQDQELLVERHVPKDKLPVIPNGVHQDYFNDPAADAVASTCAKFNLPLIKDLSLPVCFFVANHTRNKGLDVLIDAFLSSEKPYCLIVGGKKRDYDYDGFASRAKSNQRILFTDTLTDQEIRVLHHYADLFVFPTRADTLPLVVLEAMAAARPVLSTRIGGIPFQVDDRCGRLVEPDNPTALRIAFEEMFQDRERLIAMGIAASQRARELFDWQRSAKLTYEVYQQAFYS